MGVGVKLRASVLRDDPGYFLANTLVTLSEALVGLGIGFVAAFVLAVVVSEVGVVRRAVIVLGPVRSVRQAPARMPYGSCRSPRSAGRRA